jgi:hypothetical protein
MARHLTRFPRLCTLSLWAIPLVGALALAAGLAMPGAGGAARHSAVEAAAHAPVPPTADAISAARKGEPAPFLASASPHLELPATERTPHGVGPARAARTFDRSTPGEYALRSVASRIRAVQLRHASFAAAHAAARAGLLTSRTTAPPPPLG